MLNLLAVVNRPQQSYLNARTVIISSLTDSHNPTQAYLAGVSTQVVGAGGTVLARVGHALVHLILAVAARVARLASAEVGVASIETLTRVTAQVGHLHTCSKPKTDREQSS